MEKYGFVYIWFDRKHKRYYIGCHWGTETDGYICSSNWMRDAYRRRPDDFKRRILKTNIQNKKEMFETEQYYFTMINPEELRTRYYNLNISFKHWILMDKLPSKGMGGKTHSEETKIKIRNMKKKQDKTFKPASKYKYITPTGIYTDFQEAITKNNITKTILINRCIANNIKPIKKVDRLMDYGIEIIGKTWNELGWGVEYI